MTRVSIAKQVETLISAKLEEKNVELIEVEYKKEHDEQVLRIFIDTEKGVDLDTCTMATRSIKDIIDTQNIFYDHMEVSSPGIDRLLKKDSHFQKFCKHRVKVKTVNSLGGRKNFIGILVDANQAYLDIEIEGELVQIPRDLVSQVRLHPDI